jgi:hypothetical protein
LCEAFHTPRQFSLARQAPQIGAWRWLTLPAHWQRVRGGHAGGSDFGGDGCECLYTEPPRPERNFGVSLRRCWFQRRTLRRSGALQTKTPRCTRSCLPPCRPRRTDVMSCLFARRGDAGQRPWEKWCGRPPVTVCRAGLLRPSLHPARLPNACPPARPAPHTSECSPVEPSDPTVASHATSRPLPPFSEAFLYAASAMLLRRPGFSTSSAQSAWCR